MAFQHPVANTLSAARQVGGRSNICAGKCRQQIAGLQTRFTFAKVATIDQYVGLVGKVRSEGFQNLCIFPLHCLQIQAGTAQLQTAGRAMAQYMDGIQADPALQGIPDLQHAILACRQHNDFCAGMPVDKRLNVSDCSVHEYDFTYGLWQARQRRKNRDVPLLRCRAVAAFGRALSHVGMLVTHYTCGRVYLIQQVQSGNRQRRVKHNARLQCQSSGRRAQRVAHGTWMLFHRLPQNVKFCNKNFLQQILPGLHRLTNLTR